MARRLFNTLSFLLAGFATAAPAGAQVPDFPLFTEGAAPVDSKKTYTPGWLAAFAGEGRPRDPVPLEIRGRGNSTWGFPKKPYKLRFFEKEPLLGMPADRDWVLFANFSDKTLLRNHLAFSFSRSLSLRYTPRAEFVDLSLNQEFLGNYLLVEQIKVAPHRLDIVRLRKGDTEGEALTGGYLLEICERMDEPFSFRTARGLPFMLKEPSEPQPAQGEYIRAHLQAVEDAIFSPDFADPTHGYAAYIDVGQFVDWYLVNELFRNQDAASYSSIYVHKDRGRKLAMGPVWDFDLSAGNVNYDDNHLAEGWWIRKRSPWFRRLFEDPAFAARVRSRWQEIRPRQVEALLLEVDRKSVV